MIRIHGKALVATWRPFEEGGQSHMRASQIPSDNVSIVDNIVIAQHKDGFWGTYPLVNCSVIWDGKPIVIHVGDDDHETILNIAGLDHTFADELTGKASFISKTKAMATSEGAMEGALDMEFFTPAAKKVVEEEHQPEQAPEHKPTEPVQGTPYTL